MEVEGTIVMLVGPGSARKYDLVIDPTQETSHTRVLRLVGTGKRVLDLGCAYGALAEQLKVHGCSVVGVERDQEAAEAARQHCEQVLISDLDRDDLDSLVGLGRFDVIVAADVLEHLSDPGRLLDVILPLLAPDGYLVTSIPNVAHGSVRLALLAGRFPYSALGLLDDTHLRFYTRQSMTELLQASGFTVAYVEDQLLDAELGEVLATVALDALPVEARDAVRADPDSFVYQFVAVSAPAPLAGGLLDALHRTGAELGALRAQLAELRGSGGMTPAAEALAVAQEEAFTARRAQIFLEMQAAHSRARIGELEQHVERLTAVEVQRAELETTLRRQAHELEEIHGSKLWRAATIYRRGVSRGLGR